MSSLVDQAIVEASSGTAAAWTSADTVLNQGEWGYETDTGKAKIGDGSTAWTSLGYAAGSGVVTATQYDTGWVANSDWTDLNVSINHALNANLSNMIVNFLLSSDGTDNESIMPKHVSYDRASVSDQAQGVVFFQDDLNNITLQTGTDGISSLIDGTGALQFVDTESWYYKVVVTKLTIN